jgi:hypothetical protein
VTNLFPKISDDYDTSKILETGVEYSIDLCLKVNFIKFKLSKNLKFFIWKGIQILIAQFKLDAEKLEFWLINMMRRRFIWILLRLNINEKTFNERKT